MDALVSTTAALLAVCALAVLVLRLLGRRNGATTGLRVVARLALDARRALYVVDVGGRHLVLGAGDGPLALVAELDAAQAARLQASDAAPPVPWARWLRRKTVS